MTFNEELSRKYGVKVWDSTNKQFPHFVAAMNDINQEDCCTEEEIADFVEFTKKNNDGLRPWALEIMGLYDAYDMYKGSDEPIDVSALEDEIEWYIETMYGLKESDEYPEWLASYLNEIEEMWDGDDDTHMAIIKKVLPHLN